MLSFTLSRRLFRRLCLFVLCGLLPALLTAQSFDASTLHQFADLGVTWLVNTGDNPAYARPDFDDSRWMRVDTTRSLKDYFPSRHPSIVWYRLHLKVAPDQKGLSLEEFNLASAFEIYVNGERLFVNGSVAPYRPYGYSARIVKRLPDAALQSGSIVIALRLYISGQDWLGSFPGYYPYNLIIGQGSALNDHVWLAAIGDYFVVWFQLFAGLGLGIVALALYTAQRGQHEYLWIFLMFLSEAIRAPFQFYGVFHNLPNRWIYFSTAFDIAAMVMQALMFLAFLRLPPPRWLKVWLVVAAAGRFCNAWQAASGSGTVFGMLISLMPELGLLAVIIPVLLILHWRRGNREAGILLIPALIVSLTIYAQLGLFILGVIPGLSGLALRLQNVIFNWTLGPFTINAVNVDGCFFVLTLAVILVLRSARIAQHQAHIETELAAAREVQKILLPEQIERVPGFQIEAVYEPALQVGGDFFQILPAAQDSLLLVVGDVAGKGLPAAMLVSVLVGAMRGVAEYTHDPAEILANLNQRLVGRVAGSLATALAVRIFPDGAVLLANAGHLSPYLDGQELPVAGALPLGAQAGSRYETARFQLPRGSRLTFYSDGIVEARNAFGEIFGFDRGREISILPVNAIIQAAKAFGQQDDMTAIAITRDAAAARDPQAQPASRVAPALAD